MNSTNDDKQSKTLPQKNEKPPVVIEDFIKDFRRKGVFALANMRKDEQTLIINWAQDFVNKYGSVLMEYPMKIKNLVGLPCPKEDLKVAIKVLLPAYLAKGSDDIVNLLKDRYVRLSAFQEISQEDKETIIKESTEIDQNSVSTDTSLFPTYHRYMQIIVSEQKVLLDEIDTLLTICRYKKRIPKVIIAFQ